MPPPSKRSRSAAENHTVVKKFKSSTKKAKIDEIPQLNDDCLLKIFSYLSVENLCDVKACSRRFSDLADSVVRSKYRKKVYHCYFVDFIHDDGDWPVLPMFSTCISNLCIQNGGFRPKDAKKFNKQLRNFTSLKTLTLQKVELSLISVRGPVSSVLQNIEKLELCQCTGRYWQFTELVKVCYKLKNLSLQLDLSVKISSDTNALVYNINDHENIEYIHVSCDDPCLNRIKNVQQLTKLKKLTISWNLLAGDCEATKIISTLATRDILDEFWLLNLDPDDDFFKEFNKFNNLKMCVLGTKKKAISATQMALANKFDFKRVFGGRYTITPKCHI